jgi:IgGFc binding protein/Secretion system C-terminal sorting domain
MKKLLYCFLFFYSSLPVYSQTGTDFWIAPPDVTDLNNPPGGEPIYLFIQSQSNADVTATVSQPANGGFTPIIVNITPRTTARINLTPFKSQLETRPTNTINNTGLRIQSNGPVSVQYEIANINNSDFTSLKGNNALGNYFYIPFHKYAPFFNQTFASPHQAFASFDIVATQNNTLVRIYPPIPCDGHPALQQFTITLNAGQTYSMGYTGTNYEQPSTHPSGAVVLSDKPVAISLKDDSQHNPSGGCIDLQFEQIVPVGNIGNDYIAVKGGMNSNGDESVMIMATINGTDLYLDGSSTPVTTLFAGEYYRLDMDYLFAGPNNSVYIHATQPIYAMHFTGLGCEMGDALMPPLNFGTTAINISRTTAESFFVTLVARSTNINNFTIAGTGTATINPASFITVPGTGGQYSAARIQYNTTEFPLDSTFTIQNSTGSFLVAVTNGGSATGVRYTYLSPFGASGSLPLRLLQLSGRIQPDGNYLEWLAGEDGEHYRYDVQVLQTTGWTTIESKQSGIIVANQTYHYIQPLQDRLSRLYRIAATELSINKTIYSNTIMLNRITEGRNTMNVYSDPATGQITVQLGDTNGTITARIYTSNGQLVQQSSERTNSFILDIRQLPPGIYMLKVTDARNQWQQKITRL